MFPRVNSARFLGGATKLTKLPATSLPEISVLGRSNVGKSTFINRLCNMKKLARASSTPGRTREINLFEVSLALSKSKTLRVALADLPGFGFAKLSKTEREALAQLTVEYIRERSALKCILLLNDARRDAEDDERAVQELAHNHDRRLLIVLTKSDKLKRSALISRRKEVAAQYGLEADDVLVSGDGLETNEIWRRVVAVL